MAQQSSKSRRKFLVLMSLVGVLTITSALLLVLAPPPLRAGAWTTLLAADDMQVVFQTHVMIQPGRWKYIYIHHSKTTGGNAIGLGQAADGLGDHFLVGNGDGCGDGEIQIGQRWNQQIPALPPEGAASIDPSCISICVIGDLDNMRPTAMQVRKLRELVNFLQGRLRIAPAAVQLVVTQSPSAAGIGRYFPATAFREQLLP